MDKQQFITILQCALFSFDGAKKQEILNYNLYPEPLIDAGIKLSEYLKFLEVKNK